MELSSASSLPTGYLLTKIAQLVAGRFAEAIAPLQIRPKHYGLLTTVATLPPGSQQQLGHVLGLVPSAIVSIVDDLEALGAVARRAVPNNRRQFLIELTDQGRRLLNEATRRGAEIDTQVLQGLGETEQATFQNLLMALAVQLDLIPAGPAAPGGS